MMFKALLKAFTVLSFLITVFVWIGYSVTELEGGEKAPYTFTGINIKSGEAIFWGKGKCYTCHSVGYKGSAIRCPNLGEHGEKFSLLIGQRATERAKERKKKTGKHYTPTDYLIESIARPDAYVVEGYKNEMPRVFEPPISLTPDEVKSALVYLLSLRYEELNDKDIEAIIYPGSDVAREMMKEIMTASASAKNIIPFKPYMQGDPDEGAKIFFNSKGSTPCGKCHTVRSRGGMVGPDLSMIATTRTTEFIVESILNPSKVIASGFEPVLVVTEDMRYITGIKKLENDTFIEVMQANGEILKISRDEISIIAPQKKSIMPENFAELFNIKHFHDLLAYLQTLKGELRPQKKVEIVKKRKSDGEG